MFSELIHEAVKKFTTRSALVFLVIHAGLVLAVYGLASIPHSGDPAAVNAWRFLLAGIAGLYGGVVLGAFFVIWPLYSLVRKVRKILRWREWILQELPRILALIPSVVQAFRGMSGQNAERGPSPAPQTQAQPVASPQAEPVAAGDGFPPAA